MAKNQPIKAVEVRTSNLINIPEPGSYISGTNQTGGLGGTIVTDSNANFLGVSNPGNTGVSNKVNIGDIIYIDDVLGNPSISRILSVDSNTQITTNALASGTSAYKIYRSNGTFNGPLVEQGKTGMEGYSLYVGGGGDVSVIPAASEDTVILKGVADGAFIPLQVVRVNSTGTTATDILALE